MKLFQSWKTKLDQRWEDLLHQFSVDNWSVTRLIYVHKGKTYTFFVKKSFRITDTCERSNIMSICGGGKKGSFNSWHMLTVYCGGGRGTIILKNNRLNIERSWTLIFKGDCVQFWLDNSWKLNILPTSFFQQFQIQFSMFLMFHVSTSFNTYFLIYPHPLP